MVPQWNAFVFVTASAGLLSLVGAAIISRTKARGTYGAILFQIFSFIWNVAYTIELTRGNLEQMVFWDKICMVSASLAPLFFLLYTAEFTKFTAIFKPIWLFLLGLTPGIFISLLLANDHHRLVFATSWIAYEGGSMVLAHQYGPVIWGIYAHAITLILTSITILFLASYRSMGFYRRHASVMAWSAFVPILAALVHFTRLIPTYVSGTSTGIALTGTLVTLSFIRLNRGDVIRISKSVAFDQIAPGFIVFDEHDKAIDISEKSIQLLGKTRQDILGKRPSDVFPVLENMELNSPNDTLTIETKEKVLELDCTPLMDWQNNCLGKIIILHDITQERRRSNELALLLEASRSTASKQDLKTVLQTLASQLLEVSGFESCVILEWAKEKSKVYLRYDRTRLYKDARVYKDGKGEEYDYYDLGKYLTTYNALTTGQPVILQGEINVAEKEWMHELGRTGVIILPLEAMGQVIGLAEIATNKSDNLFDEEDITRCRAILSAANADLVCPISKNDQQKLHSLGAAFLNATNADVCSLSDWEKSENRLRTVIVDSDYYCEAGQGPVFDMEQYELHRSALQDGAASIIVWDESDPATASFLKDFALKAQTYIVFPMQKGDERIGIIELYDFYHAHRLGQDQIALLRALSDQAGFTIFNARLLAELQREARISSGLIKELESKNAELEQFTYTVSHDLKSPLITINGFLGYLEKDAVEGNMVRINRDVRRIQEAVNKMYALLNDLLELSRIGRLMNPPQMIPFGEIVNDALKIVQGILDTRGITVQIQADLPLVHGDRQRLIEVLQNLLDNAAKFMGGQSDPRIEVGQRSEDAERGGAVFYVKDNGIGIAPEHHERVFGLFNQLDPKMGGTGVGLALVKRIIEFHGGRIWVESEAGKGATFFFTLSNVQASEVVK